VLVHFMQRCLETEETKPKSVYMNFSDYKKRMSARYGADYYFVEDECNYAKRVAAETLGVGGGAKPIGSKGHFEVVWRTTHAAMPTRQVTIASSQALMPISINASGRIGSSIG
jgi:hypothetical protein